MKFACWLLPLALGFRALAADTETNRWTAPQRLETAHLRATHEARERFARERMTLPNLGVYEDFRGVMHIHAEDSDHTKGTRAEVLAGAKRAGVQVVMFTDHRGPRPETWRGLREGVLFFAGSEDGEGVLRFPEFDGEGGALTNGALRFLSHIEERYETNSDGFTGLEICNRHTDAKLDPSVYLYLMAAEKIPAAWNQLVENFKAYPDEVFAAGADYREGIFAKWDRDTQKHPLTGIGANDAHQNQIYKGTTFDPYEISFRNLCTHILARALTETAIRAALRDGHAYVSHDWLCDPTGFAFGAGNNLGVFTMGDTVPWIGSTKIAAVTPLPAHLKLIHNGAVARELTGTNLTFDATEPGPYRLEAWLQIDGEERPWIYSNPVYLKSPSLTEMRLPANDISPSVEVKKDLTYTDGKPEDEGKHRLDLYIPKGQSQAPIFLFVHGGAWRFGDRSQYVALGNRFAREGILTVIPSYRLAPKNPHPAQIEDVADAFAWTVAHAAEWGGDTNRIFVGGHSAGGHLAALLTLDEERLRMRHLSTKLIRGTIALSGVYDLSIGDGQASVFGHDLIARREASPRFHIHPGAPPFLVTYCQWDYLSLPLQARVFSAALRDAGIASDLVFVPRESHISEMVHAPNEGDPTAQAILQFIRAGAASR